MNQVLAKELTLPGNNYSIADPYNTLGNFGTIGGLLGGEGGLYNIILWVALVLMFSWMVWGIFQYLFAGGNKEALGKARSRITWAIVGFVIVVLAFTLQRYAKEIFPPRDNQNTTPISIPGNSVNPTNPPGGTLNNIYAPGNFTQYGQ